MSSTNNYIYSESDALNLFSSLNSESSEVFDSEIDREMGCKESIGDNVNVSKRSRSNNKKKQKKIKYWILPTMSSGTFDPSMLTARQQLQYLAQKSRLGEESESLELSPLRLDRIKFEEMKSLKEKDSENICGNGNGIHTKPLPFEANSNSSTSSISLNSNNIQSSIVPRGSKLKEEIVTCSSPLRDNRNQKKKKLNLSLRLNVKMKLDESKENIKTILELSDDKNFVNENDNDHVNLVILKDIENDKDNLLKETKNQMTMTNIIDIEQHLISKLELDSKVYNNPNPNPYNNNNNNINTIRQSHFDNFLQDFANRKNLPLDCEIIKRKRQEIINKGMMI